VSRCFCGWSSALDPAGGAYQTLLRGPLHGGRERKGGKGRRDGMGRK